MAPRRLTHWVCSDVFLTGGPGEDTHKQELVGGTRDQPVFASGYDVTSKLEVSPGEGGASGRPDGRGRRVCSLKGCDSSAQGQAAAAAALGRRGIRQSKP